MEAQYRKFLVDFQRLRKLEDNYIRYRTLASEQKYKCLRKKLDEAANKLLKKAPDSHEQGELFS